MQSIVALFDTPAQAEATIGELEMAGFPRAEISVVVGGGSRNAESDLRASGMGVAIGTGLGLLAGLAAVAVPGVGLVFALGPILASGVVGAVAGGLVGSLVDIGVPALEARYYQEAVRRGGTLMSLAVEDSEQIRALEIINKHKPVDIKERAMAWHDEGWNEQGADLSLAGGEEVEAAPVSALPMGTMAAPTAQPTREVRGG